MLSLQVIEWSQSSANKWQRAAGPARRRDQLARLLEGAASALEESLKSLEAVVSDDFRSLPPSVLKTAQNLARQMDPHEDEAKWPDYLPSPHPNTIIRGLRFYSRLFRTLPQLRDVEMPYSEGLGARDRLQLTRLSIPGEQSRS